MKGRTPGAIALPDQVKQCVFQEHAAGKDGQPGRFRQHQDVVIFEQGPEIGWSLGLFPGKSMVDQAVAPGQSFARRYRPPIEQNLPCFDPLPNFGTQILPLPKFRPKESISSIQPQRLLFMNLMPIPHFSLHPPPKS